MKEWCYWFAEGYDETEVQAHGKEYLTFCRLPSIDLVGVIKDKGP